MRPVLHWGAQRARGDTGTVLVAASDAPIAFAVMRVGAVRPRAAVSPISPAATPHSFITSLLGTSQSWLTTLRHRAAKLRGRSFAELRERGGQALSAAL